MAKKKTGARSTSSTSTRPAARDEPAAPPAEATEQSAPTKEGPRTAWSLKDREAEQALISGEHRDLLEGYFGEEVYEELRSLAARAQRTRVRGGPRVLIVPGIMGSKLGVPGRLFDDTLWIDPVDLITGRLSELALANGPGVIRPLGVILLTYLQLKLRLRLAGFDADYFPYDWRRDIAILGREMAERIRFETKDRRGELYLVAHSMGGLVCRAAMRELQDEGGAEKVRRLVMLGTPNFGSFSPVQVLSGGHSLMRKLAAVDTRHSYEDLVVSVLSTFTGLCQMLPAPERFAGIDFFNPASWPEGPMGPRPEILLAAAGIQGLLAPAQEGFVLIAGVDQETVVSARREGDAFLYGISREGDGTVPLALARLAETVTYFVEEAHGSLPNNRKVQQAVIDLLETGRARLPTEWTPTTRGVLREVPGEALAPVPFDGRTGKEVTQRELRHLIDELAAPPPRTGVIAPTPAGLPSTAVSGEPIVIGRQRQQRIDLRLAHGSITQVDTRAVVLGLFRGVAPAGAAAAIDWQLDGVITDFTQRRMLTANVGEVFVMPANRYRLGAELVVFVGLGTFDDFDAEVLRLAAENVARVMTRTKVDDFATVLMSSGSGMPTADVLANLVEGFLRGLRDADKGHLRAVTFCESDRERFAEMHREMLRLTTTPLFDAVEATVALEELPPAPPPAPIPGRAAPGGAMEDPVYLIVRDEPDLGPEPTAPGIETDFSLRASLLTAGRKATVVTDTLAVDGATLERHLRRIEEQDGFTEASLRDFGSKLCELVLPDLVRKALIGEKGRWVIMIHDARTGVVPWETLCIDGWYPSAGLSGGGDGAGAGGMSRKYEAEDLSVAKWLEERRIAPQLRILLVIDPTEDLPGAKAEGERIARLLGGFAGVQVDALRGAEATWSAVRAAFRSGEYDLVHYAGHAFFDPYNRARSGIICHGEQVLSGIDLASLEKLPALMFFNACESARVRGSGGRRTDRQRGRRVEQNAGLAESLLRAGVGSYIGTYWPVSDEPAERFALTFYQALIQGESIGTALARARARLRDDGHPDWADYIHYGSPGFVLKRRE